MSGRIRTIKPEVLEDEIAAGLSDAAWRLWVSLWVLADDLGNVRMGDRYVAAQVWQDTTRDVCAPVEELITKGRLTPYAVRGQRYAHINGWGAHQRIDNAGKAKVPTLQEDDGTWNQPLSANLAATFRESQRLAELSASRGSRDAGARSPAAGMGRGGGEGVDHGAAAAAPPPPPPKLKPAKSHRIPEDWEPAPDLVERLRRDHLVDPLPAVRRFRNHFLAMSEKNKNAFKPRWDLAFENWVERDAADGKLPRIESGTLPLIRLPDRDKFIPKPGEEPDMGVLFREGSG